jgi:tetratricopeptide (TPR) repeat protein
LPWGLAGVALGALVTILAMRGTRSSGAGSETFPEPTAPFASSGGVRPPDISQMTPEERATRLYNRVMTLVENGRADSAQFFLPMALSAYAQLPTLDADTRFHVGMLELAAGDANAALAEADTIGRSIPTHLFIYILRAHAYEELGNKALEQKAYADFLRHETAELALKRSEYDEHRNPLNSFHNEAVRQSQNARTATP